MTRIPAAVETEFLRLLEKRFAEKILLRGFSPIAGGCINQGGRVSTSAGDFFIKWNDAAKFPGMFEAEAKGLTLLKACRTIYIPEVISQGTEHNWQFIVLEFVNSTNRSQSFWKDLGTELAELHRNTDTHFGLDHNNFMGSLRQINDQSIAWIDFFVNNRLQPQLKLATDNGLISPFVVQKFETLYKKLSSVLATEKPALLHGDLWNGNLIINHQGGPCLIDPAVYYGHREVDLAMTRLFGGFADEFYESYHESFPLTPGFRERYDIYNLYPLLIHVNLFGSSYIPQINSIIASFV